MARTQANVRLTAHDLEALRGLDRKAPATVVYAALGQALAWRLTHDTQYPLDVRFVSRATHDTRFAVALTLAASEALSDSLGVSVPHPDRADTIPRFRFAKPPAGGRWETDGVTGWAVLPRGYELTANGVRTPAGREQPGHVIDAIIEDMVLSGQETTA
ncbi:MAG: hypothetical protein ACOC46_02485 [Pirellulales bacterium]